MTWRRNLFAVTAASFIGFTGFTLVMPFLPLYFQQLGVHDVGEIAMWSGLSLGVTPALTAMLSPLWGRLADRYGRKIMVERSLVSFVFLMTALAYVRHPWQIFALRVVQGFFAGYGGLALAMAADSAPPGQMAYAIGFVQTSQRLGPAIGPIVGGVVAQLVGLRRAFMVTAGFYLVALVIVFFMYDERQAPHVEPRASAGRVTFRNVLAFENFLLLMVVIFALQFADRSFGPVLPLFVAGLGVPEDRVPIVAGVLFSIAAATGALGHHVCGSLLRRTTPRRIIAFSAAAAAAGALVYALAGNAW
ncbi:MAG: MFS transporter, partial [Acidobacteriota bacterium]